MSARPPLMMTMFFAAAFCPGPARAQQSAAPPEVPQSSPTLRPVPAPSPQEEMHRRVTVEIESTQPSTVVERRVSLTETDGSYLFLPYRSTEAIWQQVCVTPCQVDLDRFSTYRVGKVNGVVASRSFTLPQMADRFQLHIEPGNPTVRRIGIASIAVGSAALITGVALVASQRVFSDETAARSAGFITGGAGALLLAVGVPLTLLTSTKVFGLGGRMALSPRGLLF